MTKFQREVAVAVLLFCVLSAITPISARCGSFVKADGESPYMLAQRTFSSGVSDHRPKAVLVKECEPSLASEIPKTGARKADGSWRFGWYCKSGVSCCDMSDPSTPITCPTLEHMPENHVRFTEWLRDRKCNEEPIVSFDMLQAVSRRIEHQEAPVRRSWRASPAVVDVKWEGLEAAVREAEQALWPDETGLNLRLKARLQAVLAYEPGDVFDRHMDKCEVTGQEGVLVVDLGAIGSNEEDVGKSSGDPEMFFEEIAEKNGDAQQQQPAKQESWSATGAGSWVAFSMRRYHGTYVLKRRRVVAVYTLVSPHLTRKPLCSEYTGSCVKNMCALGDHLACRKT